MKYFAVIDTNVLVSAMLKWQSVPGNVMEFVLDGFIIPVLNKEIVAEYRTVLARSKFRLDEEIITDIIDSLENVGFYVDAETIDIELPDSKDRVFYEVVMEKRKEEETYLVTGNIKHFPDKPFIVTPRQMLDIILEEYDFAGEVEDE